MNTANNILEIGGVSHVYADGSRRLTVLDNVTNTFTGGNLYAIVGESGSGKTTLLSLIAGLDKIQSGNITFNGRNIKALKPQKYRQKYVNIVFQSYNLIKYMTARENVEVGLDFAGHKGSVKKEAYRLLESVGIDKQQADSLVQKLSGGQQQRVAIARCLAGDVPIIVADEPTGNLDEKNESMILDIFRQIAQSGKIVIIVTHSPEVASHAQATLYRMKEGKLHSIAHQSA